MIAKVIDNIKTFIDRHDVYKYMPFINIGFAIIVIIVFISLITYRNPTSFSVTDYEKEIKNSLNTYMDKNNITVEQNTEKFFSLSDIGYTFRYGCYNEGGVNVTNNDGQLSYDVYFACSNNEYSSGIRKLINSNDQNNKYIKIKGNTLTFLNADTAYTDNGYESNYNVNVDGNVGTENGMYLVTYNAKDGDEDYTSKRIVIVTNSISASEDDFKSTPEIVLNGSSNMDIDLGTTYIDPGYKATDLIDGDITSKVKVDGRVEVNITGTYTLTYTITNSFKNSAKVKRVVNVNNPPSDISVTTSVAPTTVTNQPVKIYINVIGSGYQKMILPNYTTIISKSHEYTVQNNGKYTFTVYNEDGTTIKKDVTISNIDKTAPFANCTLKGEKLSVQASDPNSISGYSYLIDGSYTGFINKNSYNLKYVQTAYVRIQDTANNISTISCTNQESPPSESQNPTPSTPYRDPSGYDCIKPYICYKQGDYSATYYAKEAPNPISQTGCLPTSLSIIVSKFSKLDKNGKPYTPNTLVQQVIYDDGRVTCCSTYGRAKLTMGKLNLNVSKQYNLKGNENILTNHLKLGYPALIHAVGGGDYTKGGHYMALIAINDKGEVFLSDPGRKSHTSYTGKAVNDWTTINTLEAGQVDWFMTVGP